MSTALDLDTEALKQKYAEERDKRIRPDGNDQYIEIKGHLSSYVEDPYTPRQERDPVTDHVTVAFIGGGFAGLVTGARLFEQGITDVRIIEKGGDFGGTWYWNRYPGAQCDTASMVYLPLLEETGHMPSEKYVHAPEILEHCQRIGKQFHLYEKALFHTQVKELSWDEDEGVWRFKTDRGDDFTATYVAMGTGPLHVPKLPGIPGIESFQGHTFHTSRWDYDYTGGTPEGEPMDKLGNKRVAIIGTGATSVQCIPHLARTCKELYVCQRTPSSVDERHNAPIDPNWFAEIAKPGWQKKWLENFMGNTSAMPMTEDLVNDGWTDLAKRVWKRIAALPADQRTIPHMMAAYEESDFQKMEEIRARTNRVVEDQDTAEKLKAWYQQLCKRPTFHDEYLKSFNQPGCHLLDTDGQGVERITETGVVVQGQEYQVDCIIYASGFEVGTPFERRSGYYTVGRDGLKLSDYWSEGMRSLHGMHVHGFPNMFLVQHAQAANYIVNYPHNLTEAGTTLALILKHAQETGNQRIEADKGAEDDWVQLLLQAPPTPFGSTDCTPGYYNNEGHGYDEKLTAAVRYPQGPVAFFKFIDDWRRSGDFAGLSFQ